MDIVTYALCKKMASGSKGEKGDPGEKGEQGLPGRDGADGVTPNLQVGDVVTLEAGQQASITRRGNDENPIFDFAIPKGDTGKDGIFVGRVDDAPDHAQVVVNDDASPYDLFFENANVSYMGDTYTSLKEKADADIEYLLREIQTQHYEGQRITATNTYQKQVRSAILKGNTLVNVFQFKDKNDFTQSNSASIEDNVLAFNANGNYQNFWLKNNGLIKPNTTYLFCVEVIENTTTYTDGLSTSNGAIALTSTISGSGQENCFDSGLVITINELFSNRKIIKIFKSKPELTGNESLLTRAYIQPHLLSGTLKIRMMILEYQDGMENWELPYIEGMQSVKMPVLTACGKNLFNDELEVGYYNINNGAKVNSGTRVRCVNYIKISPNSQIIIKGSKSSSTNFYKIFYDENKNFIDTSTISEVADTPQNAQYMTFYSVDTNASIDELIQIEYGTQATSYEPYKSNILTTSEDVVLHGIGDVKDELNLLTGEKTERIGEVVLDGSDDELWQVFVNKLSDSTVAFSLPKTFIQFRPTITSVISDKYKIYGTVYNYDEECMGINANDTHHLQLRISKSKASTIEELKAYLSSNPIKVQGVLGTESIKTVDLNNQKVYSYDGTTHYTTSSGVEGHLAPILSIDVPTNLPALVSRQRDTIKDLEKENEALKEEVVVVNQQRESGDLELLSSDFDLDFRLMEIEFALDIPIAATFKEVRNMARTPYEMAKILILGGKYERSDMEYKLGKYLERKQITQAQYDELIALMEANELVV